MLSAPSPPGLQTTRLRVKPSPNPLLDLIKEEFLEKPPILSMSLSPGDIDIENEECGWLFSSLADFFVGWRTSGFVSGSTSGGEKVLVKKVRMGMVKDMDGAKQLIVTQAKIWEELTLRKPHPNILPFLGVFIDKTTVYLVSELPQNGTAREYLEGKPRGGEQTFQIVKGMAAGLEHMHRNGMVHGNLKTKNILVSSTGTPRITGFDFSSWTELPISMVALNSCTPAYAAPEVLFARASTDVSDAGDGPKHEFAQAAASDMWSFGVVVYELLGGHIDLHGLGGRARSRIDCIDNLETDAGGKYFEDLWKIYSRCCDISASKRPTAREVLDCMLALEVDSEIQGEGVHPGKDESFTGTYAGR